MLADEDASSMGKPVLNADHPVFAPVQLALKARFERKTTEASLLLRYTMIVHVLTVNQAKTR